MQMRKIHMIPFGILALVFIGCAAGEGAPSNNGANSPAPAPPESTTTTAPSPAQITLAEFDQIQKGMTYEQVVAIVGSNGQVQSDYQGSTMTMKTYTFEGPSVGFMNGQATITFENGKVSNKNHFGLV